MKKNLALYALVAAALIAVPTVIRAEDKPVAKTDTAEAAAPAGKKQHGLPFHGKVTAVDSTAMTVTVGTKTYNVTADTKITKDRKPATLADITAGENIGGFAKKDDAGKLNATTINIGKKVKQTE
ncbi:MAG TPA: hypothetical protein VF492_09070 [Verrucomicrobiae bacterium]